MQNTMLDSVVSSNSQELSDASSAIKLFENPLFKVRVIMRCSKPWFVAKDVATCIEHSNVTKMCELCRGKDRIVENVAVLKQTNESLECFSGQQSPNHIDALINRGVVNDVKNLTSLNIKNENGNGAVKTTLYDLTVFNHLTHCSNLSEIPDSSNHAEI